MSLYRKIDDYFLKKRGPNDRPTRRQDHRIHVREPAKFVFTIGKNTWLIATCSWTNVLLPLVPIALTPSASLNKDDGSFWLHYFALLSAFGLFRYGCEELSIPALRIAGKIWEATVGVLSLDTEIVLIALCRGQLELVKAYVVGKVVSITLLTLGICFLTAGVRRGEDRFNETTASLFASLLATSIVPFGILALFPSGFGGDLRSPPVLSFSRAASVVLLVLFFLYHLFRYTHAQLYDDRLQELVRSDEAEYLSILNQATHTTDTARRRSSPHGSHIPGHAHTSASRNGQLNICISVVLVLGAALMTYFLTSDILTPRKDTLGVSDTFVGFCLLPLLAEVAEISRIIRLAWADQMETAITAAASTSIATALFIAPSLCLLGWCLNQPMSLSLRLLEVVSFGGSVWIFSYLIQDGKSNYMEGAMSIGLYLVQVLAFLLYG